jgi:hypothetical protein
MPAPLFQAVSNAAGHSATTGALAVAWPAHLIHDVALLFIETNGGAASPTLSVPAGFALLGTIQTTGTGTAGTKIAVYWCRATSNAMATPTIAASTDHLFAVMVTYRGVIRTGNPWNATAGGVKATASTSATLSAVTTTVADSLIVLGIAGDLDAAGAWVTGITNANLTGITERFDQGTASGLGGKLGVYTGTKATAGSTGTSAATVTSSINAFITIALTPEPTRALASTVLDNYNDNTISNLWDTVTYSNNAASTTELNSMMTLTHPNLTYNTVLTASEYSLLANNFYVEVVDAGNQTYVSHSAQILVYLDANNKIWLEAAGGNLQAFRNVAGVQTQVGTGIAYSNTTMRWWRIQESGGNITFWTAPDNGAGAPGTWVQRFVALALPFPITSVRIGMVSGNWQSEVGGSYATYNNFNGGGEPTLDTFMWMGRRWQKRPSYKPGDPMYNGQWSVDNIIEPDVNGYIKLRVSNAAGNSPIGSEMYTVDRGFGYGVYESVVEGGDLTTLHKSAVFGGMYTYDEQTLPTNNEIDMMETSAWGNALDPIGLFHTYFINTAGAKVSVEDRVDIPANSLLYHRMIWMPTKIIWESYIGTDYTGTLIFRTERTTNIPVPATERVHFNFWMFGGNGGTPATMTQRDVTVRSWAFTPVQKLPYRQVKALKYDLSVQTDLYYFDGHTAINDPGAKWGADASAFDNSTTSGSFLQEATAVGSATTDYLEGKGTTAPATSSRTISQVRVRAYGYQTNGFFNLEGKIYKAGGAELLGTIAFNTGQPPTGNLGAWTTLSAPTGGWTAAAVRDLETRLYYPNAFTPDLYAPGVNYVEVEVTSYSGTQATQVQATKSLAYRIRKSQTALTKSARYTIRRPATAITKSVKYTIRKAATALTKSLRYAAKVTRGPAQAFSLLTYTGSNGKLIPVDLSATNAVSFVFDMDYTPVGSAFSGMALELSTNSNISNGGFFFAPTSEFDGSQLELLEHGTSGYNVWQAPRRSAGLHRYVIVVDRSQTGAPFRLYVDGLAVTLTQHASYTADNNNNFTNEGLYVGGRATTSNFIIAGISDPLIYDYALTGTQAAAFSAATAPQKALQYAISQVVVTATIIGKSAAYSLRKPLSLTKSMRYAIRRPASAITRSIQYAIKRPATALTRSVSYRIKRPATAVTKQLKYSVRTVSAAISKGLTYRAERIYSVAKSVQYVTRKQISASKTLQYTVRRPVVALTKGIQYTVRRPAAALSKSINYQVKRPAAAVTRSVQYAVEKASSLSKSFKYSVRRPATAISKSTSYQVRRSAAAVTKSLQYATERAATIAKPVRYATRQTQAVISKGVQYRIRLASGITTKALGYELAFITVVALGLKYSIFRVQNITKSLQYITRRTSVIGRPLQYVTRRQPTISKGLQYATERPVAISKQVRYAVERTGISISRSLAYATRPAVTQAKQLRYVIRRPASIARSLRYTIERPASIARSMTYRIRTTPGAISRSMRYATRIAGVSITRSMAYSIDLPTVILTKALAYYIRKAPALSKPLRYALRPVTTVTKPLSYTIRAGRGVTRSLAYAVRRPAAAVTKEITYRIRRPASAVTKTIDYDVKAPKAVTKSLRYQVRTTAAAITKPIRYATERVTTSAKGLQYVIKKPIALSKQFNYRIRAAANVTKPLQYAVEKSLAITRPLRYAVAPAYGISKGVAYIVRPSYRIGKTLHYGLRTGSGSGGGSQTLMLTVDGDGFHTTGWRSEGGDWTRLTSDDGDTSRLYSPSSGDLATFTVTNPVLPAGATISSLTVYYKVKKLDPVDGLSRLLLRVSGTTYDTANHNPTTAGVYQLFSNTWNQNPANGQAWTAAALNDIEIGMKKENSAGQAVTYMYAVVTYTAPVNKVTTMMSKALQYVVQGTSTQLTTKPMAYRVRRSIPISKALRYATERPTAITRSLQYTVRKAITTTRPLRYQVEKVQAISKALRYQVRTTGAAITKPVSYSVRKGIAVTRSIKYTIRRTPGAISRSLTYRIERTGAMTKSVSYSIRKSAAITKVLDYEIRAARNVSRALSYRVELSAAISRSLAYQIRKAGAITKSMRYDVRARNTVSKSLRYTVKAPAAISRALTYRIEKAAAVTRSMAYSVKAPAAITRALRYTIEQPENISRALSYRIRTIRHTSRPLAYDIRTVTAITKGLNYRIERAATIGRSLKYSTTTGAMLMTKPLRYSVERVQTIAKALRYVTLRQPVIGKALSYQNVRHINKSKGLAYNIRQATTISKQMAYQVAIQTVVSRALQYRILSRRILSDALIYAVLIPPTVSGKLSMGQRPDRLPLGSNAPFVTIRQDRNSLLISNGKQTSVMDISQQSNSIMLQ